MSWYSKPSAWQQMEGARLKRREMISDFQSQNYALASRFQMAANIQIQGVGQLAAQSVQARMQAKAKEMQAELQERYKSFSKLV